MSESIFLALSLLILWQEFVQHDGCNKVQYDGEICMTGNIPDGGIHYKQILPDIITSVIFLIVMYEGQCRDLYEDGICALGERLFLTEDGRVECDCDEVEYEYH